MTTEAVEAVEAITKKVIAGMSRSLTNKEFGQAKDDEEQI